MPSRSRSSASPLRQQRALEVRAQILAAGRLCFGRKGLYETLVEEIAAEAGIAKGTFYLYFKDKNELIRAVADATFHELGDALREAPAQTGSWEERLSSMSRIHLDFLAAQPDRMRILHQIRGMLTFERPEWLPLRVSVEQHVDTLSQLIYAPPRPAGLTRKHAWEVGALLFGALTGAVSLWASIRGDRGLMALPAGIPGAASAFAATLARFEGEALARPPQRRTPAARAKKPRPSR